MATAATSNTYSAKSITVLEGLEAVRRRPGMYIGGVDKDGLHHLVWEIVDNSIDEVMNGHATRIIVTLHQDGRSISVADNGRGIPVDTHEKAGRSALELIFTTLHAGGKFDSDSYKVAGGLHGVGASVVNALSSKLEVQVKRDGFLWKQEYRRGKPIGSVTKVEPARGSGTTVQFTPDPEIFPEISYDSTTIAERLDVKTYLNKGLSIQFVDQKAKTSVEFCHEGGVSDLLDAITTTREDIRIAPTPFVLEREDEEIRVELAMTWTESTDEVLRSFVNTIPTRDGGTHEQGLREAVRIALQKHIKDHEFAKKGPEVKSEDIREGLVGVLSVCVREPQFQGQTKGRLNNPEVRGLVDSAVRTRLEDYLLKNKSSADAIVQRILQAAKAREASRAAASQVRRKTAISTRLNLPGKLHDCDTTDASRSELLIVEGDSAGGSAKQGRDRDLQAVLPLRGKVLNAEQAGRAKVLDNKELTDIVSALGCGIDEQFDPARLRYGKIILLTDADSDGHHIATLLLTFFYRHLRGLFDHGHIYLGCTPLYKISASKQNYWALDDRERDQILAKLPGNVRPTIVRFKGLGEMPAKDLYETTLDPSRRRLIRVVIPEDDRPFTEQTVRGLMGRDPEARFKFIMEEAYSASEIDI